LEAGINLLPPDPAIVTYPIFKLAMLAMVSIWSPTWSNARCYIWDSYGKPPTEPGDAPFPYSGFQMPWLSYLCAKQAARVQPPSELLTERTPDGGLSMIAAETRFDPTNREHMRRSRLMAGIMIGHAPDPYDLTRQVPS
jgi:hypothetical protein